MSQQETLTRRAGKFSLATLISRILGYARDASVAYVFGGAHLTDAFYTAFRVSNLLRRLLGEGALGSSFVPVFSSSLKSETRESSQNFLNALFTSLLVLLLLITAGGIIFAPWLTKIIAPGFDLDKFELTVLLTRWTFPFFLFISLAALTTGALNSLKHFFVSAVAPAMLSVSEIGYLFLCLPAMVWAFGTLSVEQQLVGLSVSAVIGGALHWGVQLPQLFRAGFRLKWRWEPKHSQSAQVVKLMVPAMIGLSVDQVNAFVDTVCATFLVEGSVTALYNSNRLMQLPLALFGIAIASVSLPTLADHHSDKNYDKVSETINQALRMIVFTVTPAALGLMVLARPIVTLLFKHGKFTEEAVVLTSGALAGYCAGLLAYSAVKVLANAFYALREPKVPVRVAAVCMGVNVVLNVVLMRPLGVTGLALATAISSWLNAILLYTALNKRLMAQGSGPIASAGGKKLSGAAFKTFLASVAMIAASGGLRLAAPGLHTGLLVLFGVLGGAIAYAAASWALKAEEQDVLLQTLGFKKSS